jgi:hypothetical protein
MSRPAQAQLAGPAQDKFTKELVQAKVTNPMNI